jgi:trehalose-phosphatase
MRALSALAALPRARVAVMSGRPLSFIEEHFRGRGLYHGGNHGLEMRGLGLAFRHKGAAAIRPIVLALVKKAEASFAGFHGVLVENKGLTMGVHDRLMPSSFRRRFNAVMEGLRAETADLPVRWRRGKRVWEVLPKVDWDKGRALTELLRRTGPAVAVAVGDDMTDEDMFRAVGRKGVSVRIGKSRESRAAYYLPRQGDVPRFLKMLAEALT